MATADTARLIAQLVLDDKDFARGINSALGGLSKLETRFDKIGSIASRGVGTAARNVERAFIGVGIAAGGAFIGAVKLAGDFEAQLNTINTIARAQPPELAKIGDGIRGIARDTGASLEDLTGAYYDLLSAGIKTADAQNVLTQANTLAIGGLSSTNEAVDLLTTAINVYGGDASKAAQFTDEFAKAIERGKVTAADLAASYAQVAPLAKELGIENAELAAGYARLTAGGTEAGEAATQMASALTALIKKTPGLEKLEKSTGKNYVAIAGAQGLNVAFEQMRVDADKAGVGIEELVGRKEALLYILQTTGPNLAAYNADLAAMGAASGTAADQMSERQKGLNFQLDRLRALAKDAGITIGSALLPKLVPLVEKLNTFINNNQAGIKKFGADLAKGFQDAAEWIGKLDFDSIGNSLKTAAFFGKTLISAFLGAPQWLQTAIVTGWGLNKITGGAVTGIFGELAKGLIKGVLGMNAGVVNIRAGVVNGAGGLGGAAPAAGAGGAGKLATAARLLGNVFLIGIAAEVASQLAAPVVALGKQLGEQLPFAKERFDFGDAFKDWRRDAPWPFGQKPPPRGMFEDFFYELFGGSVGAVPGRDMGLKPRADAGTGGPSLEQRDAAFAATLVATWARLVGTHEAAAKTFTSADLKDFRTSVTGAIDKFPERLKYLAGAQGSGAGSEKYLDLIQRDISALNALLPTATAEQAATIKTEIQTLQGIIDNKKFELTPDIVNQLTAPADKSYEAVEALRATFGQKTDTSISAVEKLRGSAVTSLGNVKASVAALQSGLGSSIDRVRNAVGGAEAAIRAKDLSVKVSVSNVNYTTVTVRDQLIRTRSASYAGTMIGGK